MRTKATYDSPPGRRCELRTCSKMIPRVRVKRLRVKLSIMKTDNSSRARKIKYFRTRARKSGRNPSNIYLLGFQPRAASVENAAALRCVSF